MSDFAIIYLLAAFTLLAALAWGAWQIVRVRRAKRRGTTSALAQESGNRRSK